MKLLNLIKISYRSLSKNKLRTLLTMIGIIIGVASVIAMLAIGEGSKQNIQSSVASLGTNAIMIFPGSMNMGGVSGGAGTSGTLRNEDVDAIRQRCDLVAAVSPVVVRRSQVIAGSANWSTVVYGVLNSYFDIRQLAVESGAQFTVPDEHAAAKVCVVGHTIVTNLFGENADPVGQTIRINNNPFRIIGVLEAKGQNTFGQDQDDVIIAPFSTVQKRMLSGNTVNSIVASAVSEDNITDAVDEITVVLRQKHKLAPSDDDNFTVRTQQDIANIFGSISNVLTILLASIAGISLLVGGIGIMNIMLVSVTERTREIGIRLAIGAKGRDVLIQFMIESVFISFLGGLIGIALGVSISWMVARFGGWPVSVTLSSVVLSFLFSAIVGMFFGWYPARKAANLNPIDALRYE